MMRCWIKLPGQVREDFRFPVGVEQKREYVYPVFQALLWGPLSRAAWDFSGNNNASHTYTFGTRKT
ncbi:hypothetical protein MUP07_01285 [Candidatus Bathyarchaeota archaeon]|nr:hypothetical protein [Candidatus Bathyarchaeota archaeon]